MASSKNIVFILRNLSLGGIPRVVLDLCSSWLRNYPLDRVHLLLLEGRIGHYDVPDGIEVHCIDKLLNDVPGKFVRFGNKLLPNLFSLLTLGRNTREVNAWAAGLEAESGRGVNFFVCGYGAFSAIWPAKLSNCVCVAHNLYGMMLRQRSGVLYAINRWLVKRQLSGVKVHAVSRSIRDAIRQQFNIVVEDIVLYNPVDVGRIRGLAAADLEQKQSFPYVLYLGRLAPEKNVDVILKAFASMECDLKVGLVIAGDGEEKGRLEEIAYSIERPITFAGRVANPYPLVSRASVIVLASDYEGLPTVLLEARALGKFIITTAAGGAAVEAVDGYPGVSLVDESGVEALAKKLASVDFYGGVSILDDLTIYSSSTVVERYREVCSV